MLCGVPSVEAFWGLTFRQYEAYTQAHEAELKERDRLNWLNGMYTASAFGMVVSKALGGKGEYTDSPLLDKAKDERQSLDADFLENPESITPEERKRKAQELFTQLHIFSANVQLNNLRKKLEKDKEEKMNG